MSLSKVLADYIIDTNYENLSKSVIDFTKLCVLDYFGSAVAGSSKGSIQKIDEFIREMGGSPQASLVTGGKTSVMQAALLNGAASHVIEQDDIHKGSIIHAATVVIPAALAVCEWKKLSGKELITTIVVGYEVCYRIGEAVTPSHYYFWHNTATCGTFGAAAATAKLLQLDREQITYALGSAGTQAAGLWEFIEDGAMSKQLHTGKAAMNGVISSLLAEKEFTSAKKILEGRRGFFEAMSNTYDVAKVTNGLGKTFKILENSFKIHASCRHTHHAMDLMVELARERKIGLKDVKKINVKTYQVAIDITDNNEPNTEYASKFSLQYCTALALLRGEGGLEAFNSESLWDKEIRELMKRVELIADPEIDREYPSKWGATIEVELENGEVICKKTDFPKGDPENPVSEKELLEKFKSLSKSWSIEDREKFVKNISSIEELETIGCLFKGSEKRVEN